MTSPHFIPFAQPKRDKRLLEKGRAARSNVSGRYEPTQRERVDDGWNSLAEDNRTGRFFHGALGNLTSQACYCENLKRKRRSNISNCEKLLA